MYTTEIDFLISCSIGIISQSFSFCFPADIPSKNTVTIFQPLSYIAVFHHSLLRNRLKYKADHAIKARPAWDHTFLFSVLISAWQFGQDGPDFDPASL
jgi:hypothetical protein